MKRKNKKLKLFSLIFMVLFVFVSQTIVYSAINSTMTIKGDAYARAEEDVRITDFRLATTNNATSSYEEFGKNHIVTEVDLIDTSSYITYYLEITNYGSVDVGIFDITGLPSGVNYSIKNYNLHDKICDDSGKCNSFIKKTYEITLSTNSTYSGNVQLNFDFRTYHKVTYTNITNNNYPTEVIDGGTLKITFKEDLKRVLVLSNNTELAYYKQVSNGQTIEINNIFNDVEVKIKEQVARLKNGDLNKVGSEVCIGEECFYIISNDGSTITMLSKYNLYVGGELNNSSENFTIYGDEATGIQDSTMLGMFSDGSIYKGVTKFSETAYWLEDNTLKDEYVAESSPYIYDNNSIIYSYVENYKKYLENQGLSLVEARLIKEEELQKLGCNYSGCKSASSWVNSTSYWTGTLYDLEYGFIATVGNGNETLSMSRFETGDFMMYYGVRPVIEIDVDEIYVPPVAKLVSGDLDTVGSEVCIKDECFYVISSDTDSVTMLAKYNLYVGGSNVSGWTAYGDEATGIQDPIMLGIRTGQSARNGTTSFSTSVYWGSVSGGTYVYDSNSLLYTYIENYKIYLESQGAIVNDARLIKLEELYALGCSSVDLGCEAAPSWVYTSSYWSGTFYGSDHVWGMYDNYLRHDQVVFSHAYGVRPVITIPKKAIRDTIEFTIDGTTYKAEEGMTWGEWVEVNPILDTFKKD